MSKRNLAAIRSVVILWAVILAPLGQTSGEILSTKGTFSGYYHVNGAGVGRFRFFIVPQKLKKELAAYDGKYIQLEVLKARQPMSPGPAVIDRIGKIKRLPSGPLKSEARIVAPGSGRAGTVDVIYTFKNITKKPVEFSAGNVAFGLGRYRQVAHPDKADTFLGTGYTRKQLTYRYNMQQPWRFISLPGGGERTHFYGKKIRLQPGEAVPFAWAGVSLKPGKHELAISVRYRPSKNSYIPVKSWTWLTLPPPRTKKPAMGKLVVRATVTRQEEWLIVDARLVNPTGKPRYIFVRPGKKRVFLPGSVQLLDKDGESLDMDLEWPSPDGPWVRKRIDKQGLPFKFRVRRKYPFSPKPVARIVLWTITDAGMEKLTVAKNLPVPALQPLPQWGPTVKGARCRIYMPCGRFDSGRQVRFYFQAESDKKHADILWINRGNRPSHVRVEIDGQPVSVYSTGVPDGHVLAFPFFGELKLAYGLKLTPGVHKLKMTVKGDPGIYTNLNGAKFRKFDGTLISNELKFEVLPHKPT